MCHQSGVKKMNKPKRPPAVPDRKLKPTLDADTLEGVDFDVDPNWPHLQPRTKAARRVFVLEYIKDFNGTNAAMRTGYCTDKNARSVACRWLAEPFTQWLLAKVLDECKDDAIVTRKEVLMNLKREACTYEPGSQASRVKAWATLARLLGMETLKVEGNVTVANKVMTVPMVATPEEFEAMAVHRQRKLRESCATSARN